MIKANQLASALYGTWLILKLDHTGLEYFDKTPAGFARSFLVAAVVAPLQLAHAAMFYETSHARLAFTPFMIVQTLAFVLSWVLFPFVMLYVGEMLNRRDRFFWQMVPYNWVQLAIALPLLTFLIMSDMHIISTSAFEYLNYFLLTVFFVYYTFIARVGLQIGIGTAFGVVILDLLLNIITSQVVARI